MAGGWPRLKAPGGRAGRESRRSRPPPSREDAAVPGAPLVLDALPAAGRRAPGHGAHLRAGLGGLAAAVRLPACPLLPADGRPALLRLPEHGALLLRELHRGADIAIWRFAKK